MPRLDKQALAEVVKRALDEDIGEAGDLTTRAIARPQDRVRGVISAQAKGVVAGLPVVKEVYRQIDPRVHVRMKAKDGQHVREGDVLAEIQGPAAAVLIGERTALNFIGMLSGMATVTARYVQATAKTRARIYDTRKTPPGLRLLAKYAVASGGGCNHRVGLYDGILIKDNHLALAGSLQEAVARVRRVYPRQPIEVEAETLEQVRAAVESRAEIILLDNFSGDRLAAAVRLSRGKAQLEVSGGMDLEAAQAAARLGVDRISIGALTHSVAWLPLHMEFA